MSSLDWIAGELARLQQAGLRRSLAERSGAQGGTIVVSGKSLVNFGSNDYLGLAADPRLIAMATNALLNSGCGAGASPLVTGRGTWHAKLEAELARFEGTETARLFPSGYAANCGAIASLVGKEDAIFSDSRNHASIIDGCRLSGASVFIYPHRDVASLAELLAKTPARRKLIATDSLFSMDGDLAPLPEIARLARDHEAMLLIDEAHATGVFGETGRGAAEHFGIESPEIIRVGTLSKGLGCSGGFVSGTAALGEWLTNRARPYVFSTAAPEAIAAAALAALQIVAKEPHRRRELLARATAFRHDLQAAGFSIGGSESQIVPVILGDPDRTMAWSHRLRDAGFFVPGIRPPSVPPGESLLRISLTFHHQADDLARLLASLRRMRDGEGKGNR